MSSAPVRQRVLDAIAETGYVSYREHYRQTLRDSAAPLTLGVLLPNWENQFRAEVEQGIRMAREELEDAAVRVVVRRCRTDLPREALDLLEELTAEGAAGLAVCALNDRAVAERIAALAAEGVPCVTFNSDLPDSGRVCFVGQDVYRSGRVAAELMGKSVPAGAAVLAAVGNRKFDGHRRRLQGFLDRMEELGFDPAGSWCGRPSTTTAPPSGRSGRPWRTARTAGIYMANLSVSGCAEAVRAQGRRGRVRVICHDINEGIRQLLLDGAVDYTIPQDFISRAARPFCC